MATPDNILSFNAKQPKQPKSSKNSKSQKSRQNQPDRSHIKLNDPFKMSKEPDKGSFFNETKVLLDKNEEFQEDIVKGTDMITYPKVEELSIMNFLVKKYNEEHPSDPIPAEMWNGDCYKTIFNEMSDYAKEIDADPWDVFALFINKIHGWKMILGEDESIIVKY